jgi:predicted DNA-binding protein with PD1-like motif
MFTIVLLLLILFAACLDSDVPAQQATKKSLAAQSGESRRMRILTLRLRPGQDLRQELEVFVKEKKIRAGFIITGVGSLRKAAIRLADQSGATVFDQKFEIVSLVGTLGQDGVHLHISISDKEGRTLGGHLVAGCLIYTTAEIVIGDAQGLWFSREQDSETGYKELRIHRVLNRRRSL